MEVKNGYKQTEIGLIPNDWDIKSMSEVGESYIGLTYSPVNVKQNGTLVLRSSNVQNGKLSFEDNVYVQMELPERVIVRANDILICVRNGSRNLIGKCALIDLKTSGSAFGAFMTIFRSKYSVFIFHQFQSNILQRQINETLGATINQITNKDLSNFRICLPSDFQEQTAIATALSDTDALIDSLEKLIAKKRNIKQGAMQELLRPKKGWEVKRLGDLSKGISSGRSETKSNTGEYPIYGSTGVIGWQHYFDYEGTKILVARVGANAGAVNIVRGKYCVSDNTLIISYDEKYVNTFYLYYNLISIKLNSFVFGSGQPLITGSLLKNIEIPFPPLAIQNEIATFLFDMDSEITTIEAKLEKYRQIKCGMMQNLLTGKIRLV